MEAHLNSFVAVGAFFFSRTMVWYCCNSPEVCAACCVDLLAWQVNTAFFARETKRVLFCVREAYLGALFVATNTRGAVLCRFFPLDILRTSNGRHTPFPRRYLGPPSRPPVGTVGERQSGRGYGRQRLVGANRACPRQALPASRKRLSLFDPNFWSCTER